MKIDPYGGHVMTFRKLVIEDVRCFVGRQEFNIRPITFLVGENSTGKSTALGCFQTLDHFVNGIESALDFNKDPFRMGAFVDIIRKSNPRKKSFRLGIGFQMKNKEETMEYSLTLAEQGRGSDPTVLEERCIFNDGEVVLDSRNREEDRSYRYWDRHYGVKVIGSTIAKNGNKEFLVKDNSHYADLSIVQRLQIASHTLNRNEDNLSSKEKEFYNFIKKYKSLLASIHYFSFNRCSYSFAPTRSKPQRTYDPLIETTSPEGSDMPMTLVNMSRADKERWEELRGRLVKFGKDSGLFTDIHVRKLGKSMGDPFQLQIKVKGPKANIIDVGYGVNQILPLLVRILEVPQEISLQGSEGSERKIFFQESKTFLMQQPEIHLHPRGQAELSSLLIDRVKEEGHNFVIETHSDYMVDRARIEIMKKRIAPEDVSLIYLEPSGNHVKVHNIAFDDQANLLGAPSSYRQFFLKESDRLLGFD